MGRTDNVVKVAGNRIGTAEVESALVSHEMVVEAVVIAKPHPTAGEQIKAFNQSFCSFEIRSAGYGRSHQKFAGACLRRIG